MPSTSCGSRPARSKRQKPSTSERTKPLLSSAAKEGAPAPEPSRLRSGAKSRKMPRGRDGGGDTSRRTVDSPSPRTPCKSKYRGGKLGAAMAGNDLLALIKSKQAQIATLQAELDE